MKITLIILGCALMLVAASNPSRPIQKDASHAITHAKTIPEMLADTSRSGDIRLSNTIDYPESASIEAATHDSDAVVLGVVTESHPIMCEGDSFVCTEFRFKVYNILAGTVSRERRGKDHLDIPPKPDEISLLQPGGTLNVNGRRVVAAVSDEPLLKQGGEYVLFLKWAPATSNPHQGSEVYVLDRGVQTVIQVKDDTISAFGPDPEHPLRAELERAFRNDLNRFVSHFVQRQSSH